LKELKKVSKKKLQHISNKLIRIISNIKILILLFEYIKDSSGNSTPSVDPPVLGKITLE
jgi:hypothetical protein